MRGRCGHTTSQGFGVVRVGIAFRAEISHRHRTGRRDQRSRRKLDIDEINDACNAVVRGFLQSHDIAQRDRQVFHSEFVVEIPRFSLRRIIRERIAAVDPRVARRQREMTYDFAIDQ